MCPAEIDMYNTVCRNKFEGLESSIGEVKTIALKTHKAICESNGKKSILSRLDKIEEVQTVGNLHKPQFVKFGIRFCPIESRDIPRIIGAIGILILALDRLGALKPILQYVLRNP